ncbi:LTA synthase family protein [Methylomonas sp. EFPC1]|uniref:LTA synthase family protein n=1 Tax=Methylomonas sp. EFPC1 TaxID=2812647 RepID=UPI00196884BE|nr:LTA synthase family protein [Methylomonas sp. EFPC1]QSB00337.1 LTA synthase family protein [Methylomonas sp. EFPC1]
MGKTVLWLILVVPLLLKGWYVDNFIYHYTGTRLLGFTQVLCNDALIYGGIFILLYFSFLPTIMRGLAAILRLAALLLFALYIIDYAIIVNFNTHLALGDAIKYADYSYKYIQQIYGLSDFGMLGLSALVLAVPLYFSWVRFKSINPYIKKWPICLILGLPLAAAFADNEKYAHAWIYKNVIDYNLTILSEAAPYSAAYVDNFSFQEHIDCQTQPVDTKNIIILMVESLSAYQSRYFSGIHDWTPNLDAIASQHQAFKNFYANGFITEDGEVALLTGLQPLYPPSSYTDDGGTSFYSFYNIKDSLPNILKKHGYKTEFLTTADLEFGNTGVWAKSVGFDYIEGHDQPEYDKWERFHFEAAPDEALYLRALDRIDKNKKNNFLLFIKTVSSHHPYINPETKEKSESAAITYTDKQIGRFYRELQNNGFFKNGLLIIVGDHHSMTPLKKAEVELYGQYKASAKVPLVIADGYQPASVENNQYQQIDVFNSLRGLVAGKQCYSDWNGVLFGAAKASPKYIIHRRGDNRDMVSIFAENEEYLVKLDGDNTRVNSKLPAEQTVRQLLVDKVNALRIARAKWALTQSAEKSD